MSLLKLPDIAQKLLPFAVLLGAIFAFSRMSKSNELVATRAAGISAWQFLTPSLVVAIGLGVLEHDRVQPGRRRVPFAICAARSALRPGPGVAARGVVDRACGCARATSSTNR